MLPLGMRMTDLCGWCFGTKKCAFRCDGINEEKTTWQSGCGRRQVRDTFYRLWFGSNNKRELSERENWESAARISRKVRFIHTKTTGVSLSTLEKTWRSMSRFMHLRSGWRQMTVPESWEKCRYCWICGTPDVWSHVGPWAHYCPWLDTGGQQRLKGSRQWP